MHQAQSGFGIATVGFQKQGKISGFGDFGQQLGKNNHIIMADGAAGACPERDKRGLQTLF